MALGGVMASLALVVMCLGGMIPLATYVCPMFCAVLLMVVLKLMQRIVHVNAMVRAFFPGKKLSGLI